MRVDVDPCDGVRKPGTVGLPLPGPDVRVVDTEGNSVPCGERGEVVIRGGENIYPKEIETALYGHDGVLEAAVVGRPDGVLGEVVIAYVALRPGAGWPRTSGRCSSRCSTSCRRTPSGSSTSRPAGARQRVATPFVGRVSPIVGAN